MNGILDGALIGCVIVYIFLDVMGGSIGLIFNTYSAVIIVMKLVSLARS